MKLAPPNLLQDVEEFLRETGVAAAVFGEAVMGDPSFVLDLRRGRDPRETTAARVRGQMAQYRAAGKFMSAKLHGRGRAGSAA